MIALTQPSCHNRLKSLNSFSVSLSVSPIYFIKTRSAIGILKAATEIPEPLLAIISEDRYKMIINHLWNAKDRLATCPNASYYTLLPGEEGELDNPSLNPDINPKAININSKVIGNIMNFKSLLNEIESCLYTVFSGLTADNLENAKLEDRLRTLRAIRPNYRIRSPRYLVHMFRIPMGGNGTQLIRQMKYLRLIP